MKKTVTVTLTITKEVNITTNSVAEDFCSCGCEHVSYSDKKCILFDTRLELNDDGNGWTAIIRCPACLAATGDLQTNEREK